MIWYSVGNCARCFWEFDGNRVPKYTIGLFQPAAPKAKAELSVKSRFGRRANDEKISNEVGGPLPTQLLLGLPLGL